MALLCSKVGCGLMSNLVASFFFSWTVRILTVCILSLNLKKKSHTTFHGWDCVLEVLFSLKGA